MGGVRGGHPSRGRVCEGCKAVSGGHADCCMPMDTGAHKLDLKAGPPRQVAFDRTYVHIRGIR